MIKPCGHRVLVKPQEIETTTKGGIILTANTKDQEQLSGIIGTVIAVGENAWKAFDDGRPWCKVGDKVAFAKYGGFIIEDPENNEQYRLLNDEDITAVITGE